MSDTTALPTCVSCRYWDATSHERAAAAQHWPAHDCRRRAPVVMPSAHTAGALMAVWPPTRPSEYCGEYQGYVVRKESTR